MPLCVTNCIKYWHSLKAPRKRTSLYTIFVVVLVGQINLQVWRSSLSIVFILGESEFTHPQVLRYSILLVVWFLVALVPYLLLILDIFYYLKNPRLFRYFRLCVDDGARSGVFALTNDEIFGFFFLKAITSCTCPSFKEVGMTGYGVLCLRIFSWLSNFLKMLS